MRIETRRQDLVIITENERDAKMLEGLGGEGANLQAEICTSDYGGLYLLIRRTNEGSKLQVGDRVQCVDSSSWANGMFGVLIHYVPPPVDEWKTRFDGLNGEYGVSPKYLKKSSEEGI